MSDTNNARRTKRYGTIVLTFSSALAIGFVMQYGDAVASRMGALETPVAGPETRVSAIDELDDIVPVTASYASTRSLSTPTPTISNMSLVSLSNIPLEEPAPQLFEAEPTVQPACEIMLDAAPAPSAMVTLTLQAPCKADSIVAFHHEGMMFQMMTDDAGTVSVDVPVLRAEAYFIAAFDDGEGAVAMTGVPEVIMYDRAALQWQGETDLQLHALEFGATYGGAGHVWSAATGDSFAAQTGAGGTLIQLGDPNLPNALMAEVYTYPSGMTSREGIIDLTVEAEVTARNCGRQIVGQTIQIDTNGTSRMQELALTVPGCDAMGEYLVLNNLFADLTLAAR